MDTIWEVLSFQYPPWDC